MWTGDSHTWFKNLCFPLFCESLTSFLGPTFHCPALRWASDHGSAEPSPALLYATGADLCAWLPGLLASAEIRLMKTHVGDWRAGRGEKLAFLLSFRWFRSCPWQWLHLLCGPSSHLGSGSISPLPPCASRHRVVAASHHSWSLGGLAVFRVPFRLFCHLPRPAPNSWRGCCLPAWTLLEQQPFCGFHGPCYLFFPLSLAKIPNAPTLFTNTSLPSSGPASPEQPPWKGHFFTKQARPWSRSPRLRGTNSLLLS